jgi:hypothetical protein
MYIMAYTTNHASIVSDLLKSQDYKGVCDISCLPKIGFIAMDDTAFGFKIPIACGFLRIVEGDFAQLDTLVSEKQASSQMRHEGISMVVNALIEEAKRLKMKGIIAFTTDLSVIARARTLGFNTMPETVISLAL